MVIALVLCFIIVLFTFLIAITAFSQANDAKNMNTHLDTEISNAFLELNERISELEKKMKMRIGK